MRSNNFLLHLSMAMTAVAWTVPLTRNTNRDDVLQAQLRHHERRARAFSSGSLDLQQGLERLVYWREPASGVARRRVSDFEPYNDPYDEGGADDGMMGETGDDDGMNPDEAFEHFSDEPYNAELKAAGPTQAPNTNTAENTSGESAREGAPDTVPSTDAVEPAVEPTADSVGLSYCHLLFYTAQIGIGAPFSQMFTLVLDTGSTDLWVPSVECDDTCYEAWRRYDQSNSSSYKPLYKNEMKDEYVSGVFSGRALQGRLAQDVVHLTSRLQVPDQGFAQIEHVDRWDGDGECPGWDGFMGLGPTDVGYTTDMIAEDFPTLLGNLKKQKLLSRNMFSFYFDSHDDYLPRGKGDDIDNPHGVIPQESSSEIVFGGVKRSHYKGCLSWHDLHPYIMMDGEKQDLAWNFELKGAKVGDVDLPSSSVAVLDSAAAVSLGSMEAVSLFATTNKMKCLAEDEETGGFVDVDCDSPYGFVRAYTECSNDLQPLVFLVDDASYTFDKSALLMAVDPSALGKTEGDWCFLTLIPVEEVSGWLLGDAFFQEYYAAFDFDQYKIGLAPRRRKDEESSEELCSEDAALDISKQGEASDSDAKSNEDQAQTPTDETGDTPVAAPVADAGVDEPVASPVAGGGDEPVSAPVAGGGDEPVATPVADAGGDEPVSAPVADAGVDTPVAAPVADGGDEQVAAPVADEPSAPLVDEPERKPTPPPISWHSTSSAEESASNDGGDSHSIAVPLALVAVGSVLGAAFILWQRRRRVRYQRASYFDDYRMGGDMELSVLD